MLSYLPCDINPDDDKETRSNKLYLGVISIGEQLYSIGAAVAEQQKALNSLEKTIAEMRIQLELLRGK